MRLVGEAAVTAGPSEDWCGCLSGVPFKEFLRQYVLNVPNIPHGIEEMAPTGRPARRAAVQARSHPPGRYNRQGSLDLSLMALDHWAYTVGSV